MKLPKIEFVYSDIYDSIYKEHYEENSQKKDYPSTELIEEYIKESKNIWAKYGNKILKGISEATGLIWTEEKVKCYVVGNAIPISDPLTLPIYPDRDYFIDVLTHELIHQMFIQGDNLEKSEDSWDYFFKKYDSEKWEIIIHIPLHASHKFLFFEILNEPAKWEKEHEMILAKFPDKYRDIYLNSWNIVEEEGYEKIIEEFKKRLR